MTKELLFMGYHVPTTQNEKVVTPASLITITQVNESDCFETPIIAKLEQRYARPNKQFKNGIIGLDMFKGKKGITLNFYSIDEIHEHLKVLIDDGYSMKRIPRHKENNLADSLFETVMSYSSELMRNKGLFKLPS